MDQFVKRHYLPKLRQEEINDLNRLISIKEAKSTTNNFPKQKAPGSDGFTGECYQIFKGKIIPIFYNFFWRTEAQGLLLTHAMRPELP